MSNTDSTTGQLGTVHIQVLGRTDHMEPDRLAMIAELPGYMQAEGVEADVYFREPGGLGVPPLESIALFIGQGVALNALYDIAKASIKGMVAWARERIRRQPTENEPREGRPVHVMIYGPSGETLKIIEVTRQGVDERFTHPSIEDG